MTHKRVGIYCHDGCLGPMYANKNELGNWEFYGISQVFGMGSAAYERRLFDDAYADMIALLSMRGVSYVCLSKNGKWGLLRITDNKTLDCEYAFIADFAYDDLDLLLSDYGINRFEYEIYNDTNGLLEKMIPSFDPVKWLDEFTVASSAGYGFRELRANIYQGTLQYVSLGGYNLGNHKIIINNEGVTENTHFFVSPPQLTEPQDRYPTHVSVIQADCIEAAKLLQNTGFNPCVLNMANRQNPGGGVLEGAGAQEENIFRRTNLFRSLYQFREYGKHYGVPRSSNSYPLDQHTGGVYSGAITVFRSSEKSGYSLLKKPFQLSFVTVPALNRPALTTLNGEYYIAGHLVGAVLQKIRTILRIAGMFGHDSIVLSAFGCGAFCNPPGHVAQLFKRVLSESEFSNRFKTIVFAIIDDHNSRKAHNPEGNFLPFLREFEN